MTDSPVNTTTALVKSRTSTSLGRNHMLFRRAGPDVSNEMTLYHGTKADSPAVSELEEEIDLAATSETGDFSQNFGFYLTDRMRAAGQFVCQPENDEDRPAAVTIFEYRWLGCNPSEILSFPDKNDQWQEFCNINNAPDEYSEEDTRWAKDLVEGKYVVTGPMDTPDDIHLTKDFWQYAVIDQNGIEKLELVKVHENIPCDRFPPGNFVDPNDSQGPSAGFSNALKDFLGIAH
ncbi:hypothetical protein GYMLUDRAFT_53904 [Collybiopsis luxurians FD-317 M1]|nr:hypothetical protein GYMLUDRAFT_53904 [Collybiopsis luxurians FD-317 M1]